MTYNVNYVLLAAVEDLRKRVDRLEKVVVFIFAFLMTVVLLGSFILAHTK